MKAQTLQVLGTGSGVGKSVIVAALCRIFLQDGYRVCPFKAQNMALNSFVTKENGEMGRAQAAQAMACRIEPSVDMNPVLIKPSSDTGAQVIVHGKPIGNMNALEYTSYKSRLINKVRQSFNRLSKQYEIVVIEGAGSPAEINLKSHDIVNMKMAQYAKAPVILVGDIDKGGVFAWLVGTLELLSKNEKEMIKGIIINKFRGDIKLLLPGIRFLERRTGIKVLGVIPYFKDIKLPEEDSLSLDACQAEKKQRKGSVNIDVIRLPHISNFTDFDALEKEPDVRLRYVKGPDELKSPDVIIIPGTKNTIADLLWMKDSGIADKILLTTDLRPSTILIGICGGYQMLGRKIFDRHHLESASKRNIEGLGILPVETHLEKEKTLTQIKARDLSSGLEVSGYEIHHGKTRILSGSKPAFEIIERNGRREKYFDGAIGRNGMALGTYIHGLFDADSYRIDFLNRLRLSKGWKAKSGRPAFTPDEHIDKLAGLIRGNIDMKLLYKILMKEV